MNVFDRSHPLDKGMPIIPADARSEVTFLTASEIEDARLALKVAVKEAKRVAVRRGAKIHPRVAALKS